MLVRDRASGDLIQEPLPHGALLRAAYAPGPWAAGALGPLISALVGWWARQGASRRAIPHFARTQGVDPTTVDRPLAAFQSLDAFFARTPPQGSRPVSSEGAACPADGRVRAFTALAADAPLPIKGQSTTLRTLLGDDALADALDGAAALLIRLSPGDLHRVVLPTDANLGPPRTLGGPLHSVHPVALSAGAPAFANRRVVIPLDGPGGPGALVAIGALNVGSVEVTAPTGRVSRGSDAAAFHLGGSAVVWISQGVLWHPDLVSATNAGVELRVRMGECVGTLSPPDPTSIRVADLPPSLDHTDQPGVSAVLDAANLLTLSGLGIAWAAIASALSGRMGLAMGLLLLCGLVDTADGFVARRLGGTRQSRQLGVMLDSLVDAVAFGLAPALILATSGLNTPLELLVLGLLPVAVVARLAAYTARARIRRPRHFRGLPSTMTALLIPLTALLAHIDATAYRTVLSALVALMSVAMLLPLPVKRPGLISQGVMGLLALATALAWLVLGHP